MFLFTLLKGVSHHIRLTLLHTKQGPSAVWHRVSALEASGSAPTERDKLSMLMDYGSQMHA